jgi:hypothetical protein
VIDYDNGCKQKGKHIFVTADRCKDELNKVLPGFEQRYKDALGSIHVKNIVRPSRYLLLQCLYEYVIQDEVPSGGSVIGDGEDVTLVNGYTSKEIDEIMESMSNDKMTKWLTVLLRNMGYYVDSYSVASTLDAFCYFGGTDKVKANLIWPSIHTKDDPRQLLVDVINTFMIHERE